MFKDLFNCDSQILYLNLFTVLNSSDNSFFYSKELFTFIGQQCILH